jgi:hypothetical protein
MANPPSPFGVMVQQTVCLKMDASIKSLFAAIDAARLAVVSALNAIKAYIRSIIDQLNPASKIAEALAEFNRQVNELIPDPTDYQTVNKMIRSCSYLDTSDIFAKPASLLKDTIDGIMGVGGYIDGMLSDLAAALEVPEFIASNMLSGIETLFQQLGILSTIDEIKKMIQCLSVVCGMPVQAYINKLSQIYTDFYLTETGDINVAQLVADSGVPYGKRGPLMAAMSGVKAKRVQFNTILDNAVDSFRSLGM